MPSRSSRCPARPASTACHRNPPEDVLGVNDQEALRAAAEPKPGDSIGPFRVESMIGEGGMGRVFRAVGPDGTVVALKVVKAELAKDDVFRRRFEREAGAAARVNHPNVVPVLATGEHEGVPYLAQQYITGGSLEDKIKRETRLDLRETVDLCTQVADGLAALP